MPINNVKTEAKDLTEHIVSGPVTDEEMFACQRDFYATGPTKLQLWDMTNATMEHLTAEGLREFILRAARLGQSRSGGKTALVAQTPVQYGMARMAENLAEIASIPYSLRLFRSREEALAWLRDEDAGLPVSETGE